MEKSVTENNCMACLSQEQLFETAETLSDIYHMLVKDFIEIKAKKMLHGPIKLCSMCFHFLQTIESFRNRCCVTVNTLANIFTATTEVFIKTEDPLLPNSIEEDLPDFKEEPAAVEIEHKIELVEEEEAIVDSEQSLQDSYFEPETSGGCPYCPKKFTIRKQLKYHVMRIHQGALPCPHCYRGFASEKEREEHLRSVQLTCTDCNETFNRPRSYKSHMAKKHPELKYFPSYGNSRFKGKRKRDQEMVTKFKCKHCNIYLPDAQSYNEHMQEERQNFVDRLSRISVKKEADLFE